MHRSQQHSRFFIRSLVALLTLIFSVMLLVPSPNPVAYANEPLLLKTFSQFSRATVFRGMFFFAARDGVHGFGLWRSDGTPDGTQLVRVIRQGPGSDEILGFQVVGDIITNDLWRSNLSSLSIGANLTSLHTMLFFNVNDDFAHRDKFGFWRSDGTEEGTVQLLPEWAYAHAVICGQAFITSQTNLYTLLIDPNRCTISGRVTDGAGNGVAGVTVSAGERSATTDANGFYALSGLSSGVYALRAEKPGCLIEPAQRAVTLPPDHDAQDFTAICLTERAFLPLVIR